MTQTQQHPSRAARPANPGLPPIHPLHPKRWTPVRLTVFLTMLEATGSVGAAVRAAGMSRQSAYRLRTRAPAIAEAWRVAERTGRGWTQGDTG
jgi:molybdenum-dependent DNA-binding transcriptional regulator ModE